MSRARALSWIRWPVVVVLAALWPHTGPEPYQMTVAILLLIWVVVASALNVVNGYTGQVSLAQGVFFGLGAYTTAIAQRDHGLSFVPIVVLALLVSAGVAAVIAVPAFRARHLQFTIFTLGLAVVFTQVLLNQRSLTGGPSGLPGIVRPGLVGIGDLGVTVTSERDMYYLCLATVVVVVAVVATVARSSIGRVFCGIRDDEDRVAALGYPTHAYKALAFVISGALGSLGGVLFAYYMGFVSPTSFGIVPAFTALMIIVVGGSGTIAGPVLGAFVIKGVPEFFRFGRDLGVLLFSLVLLAVVLLARDGLVSVFRRAWAEVERRLRRDRGAADRERPAGARHHDEAASAAAPPVEAVGTGRP
ncbi:MAG: branched-chain amino acid ABC transporter permease [Acidimicrobiia bacterium]